MIENLNPTKLDGELAASTPISKLAQASKPLSPEKLQELASKLSRGWNAVRRLRKTAETAIPLNSPQTSPSLSSPSGDELALEDELHAWLGETLDTPISHSARQHADAAVREFLHVPCSEETLLQFFRAFAAAYERMIRGRVELPSALCSKLPTDRLTIGMVGVDPDRTKMRLARLNAMHGQNSNGADLFRLFEFAGCSAEELGRYFHVPQDDMEQQLRDLWYDICESSAAL